MLAAAFDAFLLDLDGVVYIGEAPTIGAPSALRRLRQMGKEIRFLTNNPTGTDVIVKRLNALDIEAHEAEVITSGTVTALFLAERNVGSAWILGQTSLKKTLQSRGVSPLSGPPCDAVVAGWDDGITLGNIREAATVIRKGALFVATNEDRTYPDPQGPLAAVGTLVEALIAASGQRPLSMGKPQSPMFDLALKSLKAGKKKTLMIGDTPEIDILGAHRAGIQAVLMGEAPAFPHCGDFRNPDGRISSLSDLFNPGISVKKWDLPSYQWPERVEPGVAAVVIDDDGNVLLMRRSDNGLWGIPSGHVEPTETVKAAVIREVREETGLETEIERLVGIYSDPRSQVITYPDHRIRHFITTCFLCHPCGGTLQSCGPETLDTAFFPIEALPEPMMTMHPRWLADALAQVKEPFIR